MIFFYCLIFTIAIGHAKEITEHGFKCEDPNFGEAVSIDTNPFYINDNDIESRPTSGQLMQFMSESQVRVYNLQENSDHSIKSILFDPTGTSGQKRILNWLGGACPF